MDVSVIEIQLSSKDIDFLEIDKNIFENNFFKFIKINLSIFCNILKEKN